MSDKLNDNLCIKIKSLGFDEVCTEYRKADGTLFNEESHDYNEYVRDNGVTPYSINSSLGPTEYTIPTLEGCLTWLRTKKQMYIYAYPINLGDSSDLKFRTTVITLNSIDNLLQKHDSYRGALEYGIEEAIDNINL